MLLHFEDPTSFQSIQALGHRTETYDKDLTTSTFPLYVFKASYNDQQDVQFKVENSRRYANPKNPKIPESNEAKPIWSDLTRMALYDLAFKIENEMLPEMDAAKYIAEMLGRIPKIFRSCVKEVWIVTSTYNANVGK